MPKPKPAPNKLEELIDQVCSWEMYLSMTEDILEMRNADQDTLAALHRVRLAIEDLRHQIRHLEKVIHGR